MGRLNGALVPGCGANENEWWINIEMDLLVSPNYAREIAGFLIEQADHADQLSSKLESEPCGPECLTGRGHAPGCVLYRPEPCNDKVGGAGDE